MEKAVARNLVLAEYITKLPDILYKRDTKTVDVKAEVQRQTASLARYDVPFYVLTNAVKQVEVDGNLTLVPTKIFPHFKTLSLYLMRMQWAFEFIQQHPEIERVVLTDAGDVEMLHEPFDEIVDGQLYMADEPIYLSSAPLVLTNGNPTFMQDFFRQNGHFQVVNPGVIAGSRAVILEFLGYIVKLMTDQEVQVMLGKTSNGIGRLEMAIVNYVARRYFNDRLVHGRQVSTIFFERQPQSSAWFRHK
jgi:hypothetical protein